MSMDDLAPDLTEAREIPVEAIPVEMDAHELATQLVAKLCHDFISPAGAIISGLDLLEDPSAQDMRQEALNLISASAKKMVTLVHFARVAFGNERSDWRISSSGRVDDDFDHNIRRDTAYHDSKNQQGMNARGEIRLDGGSILDVSFGAAHMRAL